MFRNLLFAVVLAITSAFTFHAYYVSITEAELDEDSKTFQLTIKFIGHDLEKALLESGVEDLRLGTEKEHANANDFILKYIDKRFDILVNDAEIALTFVGKEVANDDFIYCYIESEKVKKLKSLMIENNLLTEVFPQQENMVHLTVNGQKHTLTFNKDNTKHNIELK